MIKEYVITLFYMISIPTAFISLMMSIGIYLISEVGVFFIEKTTDIETALRIKESVMMQIESFGLVGIAALSITFLFMFHPNHILFKKTAFEDAV